MCCGLIVVQYNPTTSSKITPFCYCNRGIDIMGRYTIVHDSVTFNKISDCVTEIDNDAVE